MVKESVDLLELLRKQADGADLDFLREAVAVLAQAVMDAEVSEQIGAAHGERSETRLTRRNGYRERRWDTRVGTIELEIPKLREGSYFPSLLEPRRRSERALVSVVTQAYVEGVSTRRVDDLVRSLGCDGISKSQVSRMCAELDEVVSSFLERPLDSGPYRYLWLDALTQLVREEGRVVQVAVVVATAVNAAGKRELLGIDVGTSEDGAFWLSFLRGLVARGLSGVELVTSDAHQGLRDAVATVFGGASWQRCRTHFMRNLLTRVPKSAEKLVATTVRTIYEQSSAAEVQAQHTRVVEQLEQRFPEGRGAARRRRAGDPGVHGLPGRPLAAGLVEQPAGTAQQGDPAAHQRRRHLPQPCCRRAAGRRRARRAARRVGGGAALHDDAAAAAGGRGRGRLRRGGAAADRQLANDQDGALLHHLQGRDRPAAAVPPTPTTTRPSSAPTRCVRPSSCSGARPSSVRPPALSPSGSSTPPAAARSRSS